MSMTIEQAKEVLRKEGYYVGSLWNISDVQSKYECTDEEAMQVLEDAVDNEWIIGEIWDSIDSSADIHGLKEIEDENL